MSLICSTTIPIHLILLFYSHWNNPLFTDFYRATKFVIRFGFVYEFTVKLYSNKLLICIFVCQSSFRWVFCFCLLTIHLFIRSLCSIELRLMRWIYLIRMECTTLVLNQTHHLKFDRLLNRNHNISHSMLMLIFFPSILMRKCRENNLLDFQFKTQNHFLANWIFILGEKMKIKWKTRQFSIATNSMELFLQFLIHFGIV